MKTKNDLRFYRGSSMKGTFRQGDLLVIEFITIEEIRKGDVVIFRSSNKFGGEGYHVHRVVDIAAEGLITRGDNNSFIDSRPVTSDNLIGRVIYMEQNGNRHRVFGGFLGRIRGSFLHARLLSRRVIGRLLRRPYHRLRKSSFFSSLWRLDIKKIYLNTPNGPLIKYVLSGKTIAQYWAAEDRFECRKPYDLIIDYPDLSCIHELKLGEQNISVSKSKAAYRNLGNIVN